MKEVFEWLAFGGSLTSLYLYGKEGLLGPIAGIITSFLFMLFGYTASVPAAIIANVVFLALHVKNLRNFIMQDEAVFIKKITKAGNLLTTEMFRVAQEAGWWTDKKSGKPIAPEDVFHRHVCLMHEELSEMVNADKKDLMDTHLPHRHGKEVELADLVIRAFQYAGASGWDLGAIIAEKTIYNTTRPDHKIENRGAPGSKKY